MTIEKVSEISGFLLNGVMPSEIPFVKGAAASVGDGGFYKRMASKYLNQCVTDLDLEKNAGYYLTNFLKDQPDGEWYEEVDRLLEKSANEIGKELYKYFYENSDESTLVKKGFSPLTLVSTAAGNIPNIVKTLAAAVLMTSAAVGGSKWLLDSEIGVGDKKEEVLKAQINEYVTKNLYNKRLKELKDEGNDI